MIIPDVIKEISRKLRQDMTPAEKILWEKLRAKKIGLKFYRQRPILVSTEYSWLDRYVIADFYSPTRKLIIELDWSVHEIKEVYLLDLEKEKLLKHLWFTILRFQNDEIFNNIYSVIKKIQTISVMCPLLFVKE